MKVYAFVIFTTNVTSVQQSTTLTDGPVLILTADYVRIFPQKKSIEMLILLFF